MTYQVKDSFGFVYGLFGLLLAVVIAGGFLYAIFTNSGYSFTILLPLFIMIALPVCLTLTILGWGVLKDSVELIE